MIFHSPKLGKAELKVIDAIRQLYVAMRYALGTPARWQGSLRRSLFARGVRGSNSIEGIMVSAEDALAVIEGEATQDADTGTQLAATGYRNAMTYVLQLGRDPAFSINDGYVKSLHFMMVGHDLSRRPGQWRPGPIYVRDEQRGENVYEGPPAEAVPKLMGELVAYMRGPQDKEHALVKGAMAHLNLVMIHPFADGNGRMGRCLHTLMLAQRGIVDPVFSSIEEYLGRNTADYYRVLANTGRGSWQPANDALEWIRFNLTAHYRQAATVRGRMTMTAKLWDELERIIAREKLPERSVYALSDAATGYKIRSAHYRHLAEVSPVVASRDLKALADAGLLIPAGERRGRIYTASEALRKNWLDIRKQHPARIPDPFEHPEILDQSSG